MNARRTWRLRWAPSLLLLAIAGGCALGSPAGPPSRGLPDPIRETLPNGLRLIIQQHGTAPVVALHLWVGAGSRDEAQDERGFSHFAEHMLFKGTATRGRGFVEREVEAVGGRTNAGTSYDYTFYYVLLPAARAVRGIEVLADMAFNSTFDPGELEREREVVFEEMRLGEDNPGGFLFRRLYALAFQGHPYGVPVIGEAGALRAASRETLRGYYKRHYVAENMAVVVAGPVDPAEIRAAVLGSFGQVPAAGHVRRPVPPPSPLPAIRRQVVERQERQSRLGLAWLAPGLGHADVPAVDLLAHILGGSRGSRLNQALRERARLVTQVSAGYSALQGGGVIAVTAQLEPGGVERVEAAILEEIRRVQEEGITAEELARAVTANEAERAFSGETADGLARRLGHAETIWSLEEERRYLARVRAVSREEVRAAARRYLGAPHAELRLVPRGSGG